MSSCLDEHKNESVDSGEESDIEPTTGEWQPAFELVGEGLLLQVTCSFPMFSISHQYGTFVLFG